MKKFFSSIIFLGIICYLYNGLAADKEDYDSVMMKAYKFAARKKYNEAYKYYQKALEFDNKQIDLYYNLSSIGEGIKSCKDAVIYMTAYLYLNPEGSEAKEISKKKISCKKSMKKTGTLNIESEPQGVEIVLENAIIGKTPITGLVLEPGKYNITLKSLDFEDINMPVSVEQEKETKTTLNLVKRKAYGLLELSINPAEGVKVYLDDKPIGETPLKEKVITLETKQYLLKLEKQGYEPWVRYFTIDRDKVTKLEAELEKIFQPPSFPIHN